MKKNHNILIILCCLLLVCVVLLPDNVYAQGNDTEISSLTITDGEQDYGILYGAPYSDSDDSKWLTLSLEGRGLRIINKEGNDIVLIDQFGAIYVDGKLCNPGESDAEAKPYAKFSYGFMYFLVVLSLMLSGYNFLIRKK